MGKVDFDPRRIRLPHAAIIGFAIGILFHACVIFAVLDDGSSAGTSTAGTGGEPNLPREEVTLPTATPTQDPTADRTDCNAIRATGDYRSDAERAWFLANCTGQQQAAPTQAPTQAPAATPTRAP